MGGVNKQLALFFEQVGKRGYLKKSIALFLTAFFISVIHFDVMRILTYFIEVGKIYYYVAAWLYLIILYLLYLGVTLVFFYLGDLSFEERTNQVRPETTQRSVNPNINISAAKDSAETSLLEENLPDSNLDTVQIALFVPPEVFKTLEQVPSKLESVE